MLTSQRLSYWNQTSLKFGSTIICIAGTLILQHVFIFFSSEITVNKVQVLCHLTCQPIHWVFVDVVNALQPSSEDFHYSNIVTSVFSPVNVKDASKNIVLKLRISGDLFIIKSQNSMWRSKSSSDNSWTRWILYG